MSLLLLFQPSELTQASIPSPVVVGFMAMPGGDDEDFADHFHASISAERIAQQNHAVIMALMGAAAAGAFECH